MRVIENGLVRNLSLIGKNTRRYLATTALTAAGVIAITSPALADGSWSNLTAVKGGFSTETPDLHTTNIKQHTSFVKAAGDAGIAALDTVNISQNSSRDIFAVYDTKSDPTKIMGTLNANGRVYIFDQNGVIFGQGSQVNVGSIVASTGFISDANLESGKLIFENVGAGGDIVNNGSITVAEGGLAAFVAPTVINNGIINAKMGTVAMASGNKVTLDLYGDNLVEIAVDGELSNALIHNKGKILAEGGTVAMTAAAAKGAVDNVINMDGIVDVSSVTVKGGKIILNGGSKGVVKIAGTLDASGTSGGDIKIKGQNVDVDSTAELIANAFHNGNGGSVYVYGNDYAIFRGRVSARGGSTSGNGGDAEISGGESVGYYGFTDLSADNGETGTLLIDPKTLNLGFGDAAITLISTTLDSLFGGTGTVYVDNQSLAGTLLFSNVNLWATETINTLADVDISTWDGPFGWKFITGHDLTLAAPVINILHNITLGTGKLNLYNLPEGTSVLGFGLLNVPTGGVNVDTLNLDAKILTRSTVGGATSLAGDDQLNSQVKTVNVLSNKAKIQQGVYLADDAGGGTVNVAPGLYKESILVPKKVVLKGANAGVDPASGLRGLETVIAPNSPGFHVTGDDVTIDGFTITGADKGVFVDDADNARIKNNIIANSSENGVHLYKSTGSVVRDNYIFNSSLDAIFARFAVNTDIISNDVFLTWDGDGIHVEHSNDVKINKNKVQLTLGNGIALDNVGGKINILDNIIGDNSFFHTHIYGNGILIKNVVGGATVQGNEIYNTRSLFGDDASGIYLINSSNVRVGGTNPGAGNIIRGADWDGIKVAGGTGNRVVGNSVRNSSRVGIYGEGTQHFSVISNRVHDSNNIFRGGIAMVGGNDIRIADNVITDNPWSDASSGIYMALVGGTNVIRDNRIWGINGDGIHVFQSNDVSIAGNRIRNTDGDGIHVSDLTGFTRIVDNNIGGWWSTIRGDGIYAKNLSSGTIAGNRIRNTVSTSPNKGSGIHLDQSSNILVGGPGTANGNIIRNADWDGIKAEGGASNRIRYNTVSNSTRVGIYGEGSDSLDILDNVVSNSNLADFGGITVLGGGNHRIGRNTVSDNLGSLADAGIYLGLVTGRNVIFRNNISDINGNGIVIHDAENVIVRDNTVEDSELRGLYVKGPNVLRTAVRGNTFTNNLIGAEFESGRVVLTGDSNTFNGGEVGIRFAPYDLGKGTFAPLSLRDDDGNPDTIFPATPVNYGGTIGAQIFNGQSKYYVELANNAFFSGGVPMWINGLNSTYDGITPSLTGGVLSQADFDAIEDKMFHYPDQPDLGIFWFGFVPPVVTDDPFNIEQKDIFNVFGAFNGDVTGLNVRITGLPNIPGGTNTARNFNNIQTFAGNTNTPSNLNEIETAAGGGSQGTPAVTEVAQNPADIEPASGTAEQTQCWGDAMSMAGSGQAVNVVYQGTMADNLSQAAACGTSF